MKVYFENDDFKLYKSDCINVLQKLKEKSVDMIFADPPYFLSNGGITCKAGRMVSVNKGDWDKSNGHDDDYRFTIKWLEEHGRPVDGRLSGPGIRKYRKVMEQRKKRLLAE